MRVPTVGSGWARRLLRESLNSTNARAYEEKAHRILEQIEERVETSTA